MARFRFSLAKLTTIALCVLSLSVHGATETVPQFGASAYASIKDKPTISSDAITMSVWFKVTAAAGAGGDYNCIFGSTGRNNFNGPLTIYHNNTSTAAARGIGFGGKIDGKYQELLYKTELADGAWHFAVATVSGATYTLYLDGQQVATKTYSPGVVAGFWQNLYFGADPANQARNFGGLVTEAALWSKALSADEVAALWNGKERLLGNEEGLWGYWPLNEGSGTALRDASGNKHTGTYTAAVTWAEETTPFILGVPVPTYEPQVDWTGEAQYPVAETDDYSVDYGEGDYTSVGQYAFTLTLKNAAPSGRIRRQSQRRCRSRSLRRRTNGLRARRFRRLRGRRAKIRRRLRQRPSSARSCRCLLRMNSPGCRSASMRSACRSRRRRTIPDLIRWSSPSM